MSDSTIFDGLTYAQGILFAVRCARRVQHLMTDPRSIAALDIAERHAKGEATRFELVDAFNSAWSFVDLDSVTQEGLAALAAAKAATVGYWAGSERFSEVILAALEYAQEASLAAADAERAAARDAELAAERTAQAEILEQIRKEVKP